MANPSSKKFNHAFTFTLFTLPAVIAILIFVEIPFVMSIFYSFTKWNGINKNPQFIGLQNFIELFTDDKVMRQSFIFTLIYTLIVVILVNAVAILLAVLLDSGIKGKNALRAAFYIPNIISLIVIGFIWRFIYSRVFDSLYNLTHIGFFQLSWLGQDKLALISVVLVTVWQALGFYLVIYIAGLQSVPGDVLEAASIDGAGRARKFFTIILPMIMPSITICVFYSLSNALKTFDVIFSLTYGGPGTATTSIALDIYNTAFVNSRYGYGTAKSVVLFLLILAITVLQVTVFKRKEVEA